MSFQRFVRAAHLHQHNYVVSVGLYSVSLSDDYAFDIYGNHVMTTSHGLGFKDDDIIRVIQVADK